MTKKLETKAKSKPEEPYKPTPHGKPGPHDAAIQKLVVIMITVCEKAVTRGEVTLQEAANACGQVGYSLRVLDMKRPK